MHGYELHSDFWHFILFVFVCVFFIFIILLFDCFVTLLHLLIFEFHIIFFSQFFRFIYFSIVLVVANLFFNLQNAYWFFISYMSVMLHQYFVYKTMVGYMKSKPYFIRNIYVYNFVFSITLYVVSSSLNCYVKKTLKKTNIDSRKKKKWIYHLSIRIVREAKSITFILFLFHFKFYC